MEEKTKQWLRLIYIVTFTVVMLVLYLNYIDTDESRTMVVSNWSFGGSGYNIFPINSNERVLFLTGHDWMFEDFLESQEYPVQLTFFYKEEKWGCGTSVGCRIDNNLYKVENEDGIVVYNV